MSPTPASRWFPPAAFYTADKCSRCGVCCGSTDGHPCEHLVINSSGRCHCAIYETRLGLRQTVDKKKFVCVPIKTVIESYGGHKDCNYVKEIRKIREQMGQPTDDLGKLTMPP